jgi:hypothetical protein
MQVAAKAFDSSSLNLITEGIGRVKPFIQPQNPCVGRVSPLSMSSYNGHPQNSTIPDAVFQRIAFPSIYIGNGLARGVLYMFIQRLWRYYRERPLIQQYPRVCV